MSVPLAEQLRRPGARRPTGGADAVAVLRGHLDDRGRIVRADPLQGMVELTRQDAGAREQVPALLRRCAADGSPAVRARARRLPAGHDGAAGAAVRDGRA